MSNKDFFNVCVKRIKTIPCHGETQIKPDLHLTFALAELGFVIEGPWLDMSLSEVKELIEICSNMKQPSQAAVPLYLGFPDEIPKLSEEFAKRIVGHFFKIFNVDVTDQLFNLDEYGADPITQCRTQEIFNKALATVKAKKNSSSTFEPIKLKMVHKYDCVDLLHDYYKTLITGINPIPEWQLSETIQWSESIKLDPKDIPFRENKSVYLASQFKSNKASLNGLSANAVLRMIAALAGVSPGLTKPPSKQEAKHFFNKLSRPDRRWLVTKLNLAAATSINSLEEELWTNKELWKPILKGCHIFGDVRVGATPGLKAAVKKLLEKPETLYNFERHLNSLEGIDKLEVLATRPTLFMRRIRESCKQTSFNTLLSVFTDLAPKIGSRELLNFSLMATTDYLSTSTLTTMQNGDVISREKSLVFTQDQGKLLADVADSAVVSKIAQGLGKLPSVGKTIVLGNDLAQPFSPDTRGSAQGISGAFKRGSITRYANLTDKVVPFLFWEQSNSDEYSRIDLDLHVLMVIPGEEDKHCYYSNTRHGGGVSTYMTYSGDIQSAPAGIGAFEAVNCNWTIAPVGTLIIPWVHVYSGQKIKELRMGWQFRDWSSLSQKPFAAKSVAESVVIDPERLGNSGSWVPNIFEVTEANTLVATNIDAFLTQDRTDSSPQNIKANVISILVQTKFRPTMEAMTLKALESLSLQSFDEDDIDGPLDETELLINEAVFTKLLEG